MILRREPYTINMLKKVSKDKCHPLMQQGDSLVVVLLSFKLGMVQVSYLLISGAFLNIQSKIYLIEIDLAVFTFILCVFYSPIVVIDLFPLIIIFSLLTAVLDTRERSFLKNNWYRLQVENFSSLSSSNTFPSILIH